MVVKASTPVAVAAQDTQRLWEAVVTRPTIGGITTPAVPVGAVDALPTPKAIYVVQVKHVPVGKPTARARATVCFYDERPQSSVAGRLVSRMMVRLRTVVTTVVGGVGFSAGLASKDALDGRHFPTTNTYISRLPALIGRNSQGDTSWR